MEKYDFLQKHHLFFIGICGISMSSLAILMVNNGKKVSGSDLLKDEMADKLNEYGIEFFCNHDEQNIADDVDLVVYSGAIKSDNVEYQYAVKKNIPLMERSEFLGMVCTFYEKVIAVGGTHGKSTTCAMLASIFMEAKLNPTLHFGGISNNFNSNILLGGKEYFITEACEYKNSFRYIKSDTCVITSTDPDHLDSYKSKKDLHDAYQNFADHANFVVVTSYTKRIKGKQILSVGENGQIVAKNLKCDTEGCFSFDCWYNEIYLTNFKLNVIGKFNVENALCAIAVCMIYRLPLTSIFYGLKNFSGVKRRNEKIATIQNIPIICDYAHHPTEIKKTLEAMRAIYPKILCVFQPHTYSRTLSFMNDFVEVLKNLDMLILYKTYPAREKEIKGGDALDLYSKIKMKGKKCYLDNKYALKKAVLENSKDYNCVLILGAGNIYEIAKNVFKS